MKILSKSVALSLTNHLHHHSATSRQRYHPRCLCVSLTHKRGSLPNYTPKPRLAERSGAPKRLACAARGAGSRGEAPVPFLSPFLCGTTKKWHQSPHSERAQQCEPVGKVVENPVFNTPINQNLKILLRKINLNYSLFIFHYSLFITPQKGAHHVISSRRRSRHVPHPHQPP